MITEGNRVRLGKLQGIVIEILHDRYEALVLFDTEEELVNMSVGELTYVGIDKRPLLQVYKELCDTLVKPMNFKKMFLDSILWLEEMIPDERTYELNDIVIQHELYRVGSYIKILESSTLNAHTYCRGAYRKIWLFEELNRVLLEDVVFGYSIAGCFD